MVSVTRRFRSSGSRTFSISRLDCSRNSRAHEQTVNDRLVYANSLLLAFDLRRSPVSGRGIINNGATMALGRFRIEHETTRNSFEQQRLNDRLGPRQKT